MVSRAARWPTGRPELLGRRAHRNVNISHLFPFCLPGVASPRRQELELMRHARHAAEWRRVKTADSTAAKNIDSII